MAFTNSDILLESGTNELEVLEFTISGRSFGINVAKVIELMQWHEPQPIPHSHPCVEGIFQPRSEVYTILDLAKYLNLQPSPTVEKDIYIITNFNKVFVAFHVHTVENIHRISWQAIEKLDELVYGANEGVVTGVAKVNGRIISILDFEKITYDFSPSTSINPNSVTLQARQEKLDMPILIAEDSALLRKMLIETLHKAGYNNILVNNNGKDAWEMLLKFRSAGEVTPEQVSLVITDIEMPQMDGHHLCKLIKNDRALKHLPVIIFSSLISEEMMIKGKEVGADSQISKPEINFMLSEIGRLLDEVETSQNAV